MDKFQKTQWLEATEFWVGTQPPKDWGVRLNKIGRKGDMAVRFSDGSCEVFTHEEGKGLTFRLSKEAPTPQPPSNKIH